MIAPGISGSNGVLIDGTPVTLSAPIEVPWYARYREITLVRECSPRSLKYCRASLMVVSMASPVSQGWAVPDTNIAKIVVEFDQVPTLGFNQWPRTSTELSRQMEATARKWDLVGLGLAYRLKHGFTTLHFVDTSYLKYESLDRVVAGIKQAYVKINVAQYFRPNVVFRNAFGNTLTRNVADDELFTGSPTIVSYDGQGTFRGVSQGTASIIATHGGRTGSGTVEVIAPLPVLMGSWSGTYRNLDVASSHGPFTVTVDGGKGLQSHAHMVWYNVGNGTSYVGDLYVRMQSDGTMAGNMIYNRAGQHIDFARWITLSVDGPGGPNTARGASWDYGTYANYWLIDLARVVN